MPCVACGRMPPPDDFPFGVSIGFGGTLHDPGCSRTHPFSAEARDRLQRALDANDIARARAQEGAHTYVIG